MGGEVGGEVGGEGEAIYNSCGFVRRALLWAA